MSAAYMQTNPYNLSIHTRGGLEFGEQVLPALLFVIHGRHKPVNRFVTNKSEYFLEF